ncbi:MAG: plastocyanin/azurin family copper-binding protein [Halobacteriales archaeon]|nr:plastocyanin/azurin family copper-binding protein [Halobacteriales archaeon]
MQRRRFLGAAGGLATTALAGCAGLIGAADSSEPADYDVGMTASLFRPPEIEVAVGETVVWKNTNSRIHTVTAYEDSLPEGAAYFATGGFDSESAAREGYSNGLKGGIDSGQTYSHTFEVPGTYGYFCVPHERAGMTGTVVVTE